MTNNKTPIAPTKLKAIISKNILDISKFQIKHKLFKYISTS